MRHAGVGWLGVTVRRRWSLFKTRWRVECFYGCGKCTQNMWQGDKQKICVFFRDKTNKKSHSFELWFSSGLSEPPVSNMSHTPVCKFAPGVHSLARESSEIPISWQNSILPSFPMLIASIIMAVGKDCSFYLSLGPGVCLTKHLAQTSPRVSLTVLVQVLHTSTSHPACSTLDQNKLLTFGICHGKSHEKAWLKAGGCYE